MKKNILKQKKGITMLETIIYLAIFSLFFISVMRFSLGIAESLRIIENKQELDRASVLIIEHIDDTFNESESVDATNSIFNNNDGVLRLLNSTYFEYTITNNTLMFDNSVSTNAITNSKINVNSFYLEPILYNSNIYGVKVNIDLSTKRDNEQNSIETLFIFK